MHRYPEELADSSFDNTGRICSPFIPYKHIADPMKFSLKLLTDQDSTTPFFSPSISRKASLMRLFAGKTQS